MLTKPRIFFLVLLLPTLVFFPSSVEGGQSYHRILPSRPLSLNPADLGDVHSIQIMMQVGEGLTTFEGEAVRPAIAQRWEISDDLKEYRFYLDPAARFSDGRPITAQDTIRSFEKVLRPSSLVWKELDIIEGAEAFHERKKDKVSGLQAVSRSVLKIVLVKAFPPFLSLLASPNFVVLPEESLAKLTQEPVPPFVGSGPYELASAMNENRIVLRKNKFYRNQNDVFYDSIFYDIVPNKDLAVQGFLNGKYQDIWPYHVDPLPAELSEKVVQIPMTTAFTWYLRLNPKNKILANPQFRQWFAKQINPEAFLRNMNLPATYQAFGYIPRGFLGHRETPRKKETRPSREVLDQAKCFPDKPCKLELIFSHDVENALGGLLQPLERFSTRFQIVLKKLPRTDWYSRITSRKYDMVFAGNSFEQYESYFCLRDLLGGLVNDEFPAAAKKMLSQRLESALKITDLASRAERYADIEQAVLSQALVIPIYHGDIPYRQVLKDVTGYSPSILGYPYLKISKLRPAERKLLSE